MRIQTARLTNYRLHQNLEVRFNDAITLIGGPNESGKSTVVEALHRALFLKAKGNTEYHRAMQSTVHTGQPEVELVFEEEGRVWTLRKRFASNGTTTLTPQGGETLRGDEAEAELARLLRVEAVTGKAVDTQWAHLWVWQGQAANDPVVHARSRQGELRQRLQPAGAEAAVQSELDTRVAEFFARASSETFRAPGIARAGTELDRAERAATLAAERLARAVKRMQDLEAEALRLENAEQELPVVLVSLAELERQQAELQARAQKLSWLRRQESDQAHQASIATDRHAALTTAHKTILKYQAELQALRDHLEPRRVNLARLADAHERARLSAENAETAHRSVVEAVRLARLRHDHAAARARSFETSEQESRLVERQSAVLALRKEMAAAEADLARLPSVDAPKLRSLQSLESKCAEARAALQAMAAGLEVLASDKPVTTGSEPVAPGEKRILTDSTDVHIGADVRLRITPGGGTTLMQARKQLADAQASLQRQLGELGLSSVAAASEALAQRQSVQTTIKSTQARLDGMDAAHLEEGLSAAVNARTAAVAEADRLRAMLSEVAEAPDKLTAAALEKDARDALAVAERQEAEAGILRDRLARALEKAARELAEDRLSCERDERRYNDLDAQFRLLVQTHGDDAARGQALLESESARKAATLCLEATRTAVAALQPELLESDLARIKRSLELKNAEAADLRTTLEVARSSLRPTGAEDPRLELTAAEASARFAGEYRDNVRRKGEAVALIHQLFQEEQLALAERFAQPLARAVTKYLQCLFGVGAEVKIALKETQFDGFSLYRPEFGAGSFDFETLSGGTREQTAAAVRLAMAEVLAEAHGGCLPVVFDDAFAYSDSTRVNQLPGMLDLAARAGLQIIVLTCNPADYSALGVPVLKMPTSPARP